MMIVPLTRQEMAPLFKGVSLLIVVIIIGVAAAEYQLNNLTLQSSYNRAFNIQRYEGSYLVHILGKEGRFSARYPIAGLVYSNHTIILKNGDGQVAIPTNITVDLRPALYWAEKWKEQFLVEAFRTKESFFHYYREIEPYLVRGREWLKEQVSRITQILAGFSQ